ncbi:MAG: hypothetical protein KatS3mg105_1163 [Gemmatales bacterium]|nr:MAG: hypothetical protein KatS3mg105_1163 [Gemmatales bacterium]
MHVNSLFQWLRDNLLLLLQLLAVVFIIYGVMAFQLHGGTATGKRYILMVDNSASMSASDTDPNRLEWAKREALKQIDAAGEKRCRHGHRIQFTSHDEAVVYEQQRPAAPSHPGTSNPRNGQRGSRKRSTWRTAWRILAVRRKRQPSGRKTWKMEKSVPMCRQRERRRKCTSILMAGFLICPDFSLGNLNVIYHAAGKMMVETDEQGKKVLKPAPESSNNVGIVTFNARRDENDPSIVGVLVRVLNFRSKALNCKLHLDVFRGGEMVSAKDREIDLPPRRPADEPGQRDAPGEAAAAFELHDLDDSRNTLFRARLAGVDDCFPLDDESWLVVGVVRKARVLIVGPFNSILHAFFDEEATRAVADVTYLGRDKLATDDYLAPAQNGAFDLVIFDRCAPKTEAQMPRANTLFIGYPPPPWRPPGEKPIDQTKTTRLVEYPHIKGWQQGHPVTQHLRALYNVGISEAFQMEGLPPRTPRLFESDRNVALLVALTRGPFTDLVLTFPLLTEKEEWNTNWPLRPSFPLFLRNVLYFLGNVEDATAEPNVVPGNVKILHPASAVDSGIVIDPKGKRIELKHGPHEQRLDFSFAETHWIGPYRVIWEDGTERLFAVNLLDSDESDLEPMPAIKIGAEQIVAGRERGQPRHIWKWFALAAFVILGLEWYLYNRRIYV